MNNVNEIKELLKAKLRAVFANYPAVVEESPEDTETLWVQVFAVPSPRVREVKDFIHDLQDEFGDALGVVLLPMVKNLEVTRKYYQQYTPVEMPAMIAAYGRFIDKQDAVYTLAKELCEAVAPLLNVAYGIDYLPKKMPSKTAAGFFPASLQGTSADTELALAA